MSYNCKGALPNVQLLIDWGLNPQFITEEFLLSQDLNLSFPFRFIEKVQKTDHHHWWLGTTRPPGHGQIKKHGGYDNLKLYAHVASWILHNGPIPEGKQVNHRCPGGDEPRCVRVDHLELGTQGDNMRHRTEDGNNCFSHIKFCGEANKNSILTWEQVREMRRLRKQGLLLRELAALFHVSIGVCSLIVRNEAWIE